MRTAIGLLCFWDYVFAFRGLFRRQVVLTHGLFVPRTAGGVLADQCWSFGMALAGPMVYAPGASCTKLFVDESASAAWRYGVRQALSEWRVMSGLLWRSSHGRLAAVGGIAALGYLAAVRITWRATRRPSLERTRRPGGRTRSIALAPLAWITGMGGARR